MKQCPTCGGSGEVPSPGWYWVQLYECGAWSDYLDFATSQEAIETAIKTGWGANARVTRNGRIIWKGTAADASDPHVASTGKPTTRESKTKGNP